MEIDWGFAWQVAGLGFGLVFVVLSILSAAMWLVGLVIRSISGMGKAEATSDKKGA